MNLNIIPLKDLCNNYKKDIVDGPFGANLKREHYKETGIPVLKIQNIKSFNITLKKMDYVDQAKFDELRRHSYTNGDIVMTKLGNPLGESAIVEGLDEGLIVADLVRIRAHKIDTKYLCYHLNSPVTSAYINSQQKGTTRPRVRIAVVRDLPISTPSLPEQQRIVAILDQAFADIEKARANAEQNLKNARELFDSYLQQVFSQRGEGWFETVVGEQLTLQRGFDITKKQQRPGKIPVVSSGGIKSHHDTHMAAGPGVVIGRKGSLGTVFFLEDDYWPHDTTLWVKDFKGNAPRLVYYYFLSLDVKHLDSGAANPALNRNLVHPISTMWPSKAKQGETLNYLDKLSEKLPRLEEVYRRKIDSLDELKKSLLQKAFTGELTKSKGMAA